MSTKDQSGIRKALKDKTERIPLRALEKRGFRNVQVLDMRTIERIVQDAVDNTLDRRLQSVSAEERTEIEREAKAEFLKLLQEHKELRAQKDASDRERDKLSSQVQNLRSELTARQQELAEEEARSLDQKSFSLSAESFVELERKVRQLFGRLMGEEQRMCLAQVGPKALKGLSEFERDLALLIDRVLGDQRDRYVEKERAEHQEKIDLLERRIAKLSKTLEQTEDTLRKVAQAKSLDPGVASIFDSVQGLDLSDIDFERKSELLKEVFIQNLSLQGKEVRPEDLEGVKPLNLPSAPSTASLPAPLAATSADVEPPARAPHPPSGFARPSEVPADFEAAF